ncbi:hypothetical protein F7725_028618 [Dissostichus mawsoni]|uniref:Uncharacterized protein n=1 Tax=Dissostichus mawsoni TaxID=36200 RepID=A0A7J5XGH0_DISMA|nr:hypothetical protein F7725_028618 [Dissostichus mawsoni]
MGTAVLFKLPERSLWDGKAQLTQGKFPSFIPSLLLSFNPSLSTSAPSPPLPPPPATLDSLHPTHPYPSLSEKLSSYNMMAIC